MRNYTTFAILLLAAALASPLRAGDGWKAWIKPQEFEQLCARLARNVDLFNRVWEADGEAELYGGTSRDFVWFVRGELSGATSEADLRRRVKELEGRSIDAREFLAAESDVDVITDHQAWDIPYDRKAVTRIEPIPRSFFEPGEESFEREQRQGYIPVEKIRLGKNGVSHLPDVDQGDGVREIYDGRPTLHTSPRITETDFYQARENHSILLALRYLRQLAVTYYQLHGKEHPTPAALLAIIPEASRLELESVIERLRRDPDSLLPFLENATFRKRLNRALQKAFRSYTNPDAAKELFARFGVDRLLEAYGDRIEPYHTMMYRKNRNPRDLAKHRAALSIPASGYLTTVARYFEKNGLAPEADGSFPVFHGTERMENYRSIVFHGNIPSEGGSAGDGVYVVDSRSRDFAETWKGDKTLLVRLDLDPGATVVDITEGPGRGAFLEFLEKRPRWYLDGRPVRPSYVSDESAFADYVGADVVRYPYGGRFAYVIKNGAAVRGQKGISPPLMTAGEAHRYLVSHGSSPERFAELVAFDPSLFHHWPYLLRELGEERAVEIARRNLPAAEKAASLSDLLTNPVWRRHPAAWEETLFDAASKLTEPSDKPVVLKLAKSLPGLPPAAQATLFRALTRYGATRTQMEAFALVHEHPGWPEPLWRDIVLLLSVSKQRFGNLSRGRLFDELMKRPIFPEAFRHMAVKERAELAARILRQLPGQYPLPETRAPALTEKLEKALRVSRDQIESGTAWLFAKEGGRLTAEAFRKAEKDLGYTAGDLETLPTWARAFALRALSESESWRCEDVNQDLQHRFLRGLKGNNEETQYLGRHAEALLAIPKYNRYGAPGLSILDIDEYFRNFIVTPGALTAELRVEVLSAVYRAKPSLATPEEWKAQFAPLQEALGKRLRAMLKKEPDFGDNFLPSRSRPVRSDAPTESNPRALYRAAFLIPDAFRDPGIATALLKSESLGTKAAEALASLDDWSAGLWETVLARLGSPERISGVDSALALSLQSRKPPVLARKPGTPLELATAAFDSYDRVARSSLTPSELDLESVKRVLLAAYGVPEAHFDLVWPLLRGDVSNIRPDTFRRAREVLGFSLSNLKGLSVSRRAEVLADLWEKDSGLVSETEWRDLFAQVEDALVKSFDDIPGDMKHEAAMRRANATLGILALPAAYRKTSQLDLLDRGGTIEEMTITYLCHPERKTLDWHAIMHFLKHSRNGWLEHDWSMVSAAIARHRPLPREMWELLPALLTEKSDLRKASRPRTFVPRIALNVLEAEPIWTQGAWSAVARVLDESSDTTLKHDALSYLSSRAAWTPEVKAQIDKRIETEFDRLLAESNYPDILLPKGTSPEMLNLDSCGRKLGELTLYGK